MKSPNKPIVKKRNTANKVKQQVKAETARFDAVIPKLQKELFERAAILGGYRTLTEFIISTVKEKAEFVIKKHELFIESERDREIFFDALTNPPKPNKSLLKAVEKYKTFIFDQQKSKKSK